MEPDDDRNPTLGTRVALLAQKLELLVEMHEEDRDRFVTRDEFEPVRKIAYGAVAVLLTSLIAAICGLVFGR